MDALRQSVKRADLLSTLGAGVLGAGLALVFREWLAEFGVTFLLTGLLSHSWGMYAKHRLEQQADANLAAWERRLYWLCWVALILLSLYVIGSVL